MKKRNKTGVIGKNGKSLSLITIYRMCAARLGLPLGATSKRAMAERIRQLPDWSTLALPDRDLICRFVQAVPLHQRINPPYRKNMAAVEARSAKRQETEGFFSSQKWMHLRYTVLTHYGRKCMCCGVSDSELHVDHIKPRSRYPHLALEFSNLQVLCRACNMGKGAWDETDWRPNAINPDGPAYGTAEADHLRSI